MSVTAERFKSKHAALIRTLQAEARRFPGGYVEIGAAIDRSPQVIANALNPNDKDAAPTADMLIDVIELVQARGTLGVLAAHMGLALVEVKPVDGAQESDSAGFTRLVHEMGDVMTAMTEAMADGRITSEERARLIKEYNDLIEAAVANRNRLVGV